jgi:tRNA 2-thiouridine synthesizing protein B
MLLHTVSKSPEHQALTSCLATARTGSHVILIEDGVYAAVAGSASCGALKAAGGITVYALSPDVAARGLSGRLDSSIALIDYPAFVQLACECHAVQSWY